MCESALLRKVMSCLQSLSCFQAHVQNVPGNCGMCLIRVLKCFVMQIRHQHVCFFPCLRRGFLWIWAFIPAVILMIHDCWCALSYLYPLASTGIQLDKMKERKKMYKNNQIMDHGTVEINWEQFNFRPDRNKDCVVAHVMSWVPSSHSVCKLTAYFANLKWGLS